MPDLSRLTEETGNKPVPRFQMDDRLYDDPAVIRAGTAAFGLYSRCGDYVAGQLLDGIVPSEIASQWGTPEWIRKLLDAGLWEPVEGGYYMPRYFADKNKSRKQVEAERLAKSERQQRWLEKQRNPSSDQRRVSRRSNGASRDVSVDGSKDAAHPPSFQEGRGRAAPNGTARAAPATAPAAAVLAAAVPNGHRRAPDERQAAYAAAARDALARRSEPP